jgi:hypothetical protein
VFVHNAPQGKTMIAALYTFTRVRVVYGDPIDLSAYYGKRISQELLKEVTDFLMRRLAELGGLKPPPSDRVDAEPTLPALRISDAG